jgi:SAM-dependent methyltransferase
VEDTEEQLAFLHEALAAPEGGRLLDLPCGNGRLSLPLSLMGYEVTGVDSCEEFLLEAEKSAKKHKAEITYVRGDMRKFSERKKYDGVICMGNSFGYFNRADSLEFFVNVNKNLKAGGRFVIDTQTVAECFLVNGGEREWVRVGDILMLTENHYDCRQNRVEITYTFIRNEKTEQRRAMHWIYTAGELCQMIEQSGMSVLELYGNTDFEPFAVGSERLILIAAKH